VIDDQHLYRTPLLLEFQSKLLADGVEQGNCAIRIRLCRKLVKEAHKKLGGLDILACVAGKQNAVEKIAELTIKATGLHRKSGERSGGTCGSAVFSWKCFSFRLTLVVINTAALACRR
jgi:hypothetical protein